jgi:L-fuconolactonase
MRRRALLKFAGTAAAAWIASRVSSALGMPDSTAHGLPIIDAHIHLFDTSRPGGVPWPEKTDTAIYRPALPERLMGIAVPHGVVGAIAIEASPLLADNDWLLQVANQNPFIVGIVGDLVPGTPSFLKDLDRLHRDPLFLGIRYGNLWKRDLAVDMNRADFIPGLTAVAQAGLVLESANPTPSLIRALAEVSDKVPSLRIVVDHLPHLVELENPDARNEYWSDLRHLSQNPSVFVKLSEIPIRIGNEVVLKPEFYKARLDAIWELFGDDRTLFGSDWPNGDQVATYSETMAIARAYVSSKGAVACQKYFWKNSIAAYKWHRRRQDQPAI